MTMPYFLPDTIDDVLVINRQ
uniref:Putative apyrase 6 isoform X1 n=1 Tax=Rhizophora mucronata TaxID=61149 RepID=A0A2P2PKT7_RHIMU